jgi:iron complex transport system substrate-binding protein
MGRGAAIGVLAGLAAWIGLSGLAPAPPRRIVSLNPCLDAILLSVADPDQITALSHYSRDPSQSAVAAEARRYPFTWGSAEEVVALKPDLVLIGGTGALALNRVLPRLGVNQAHFGAPSSVAESLAQVQRIATLAGHPDRGAALAARIRAALEVDGPRPGEPRLGALIYEYHGLASGPGTLVDELMRRAGFDNLAPRYGLTRTGEVPLDALVAGPPQVLLAGRMAPGEPAWADRVLSHPVLKMIARQVRVETFPETLMFCGGPTLIPAANTLAAAREMALRGVSR